MLHYRLIIALVFSALPWIAWAEEIALIVSDDNAPYQEFAAALQQSLQGSKWRIRYTDKSVRPLDKNPVDLIVTAGSEALRHTLDSALRPPVLATLLPANTYQTLLRSSNRPPSSPISAIYLDQPAQRQARLLRLLLPDSQHIGILVNNQSENQANAFRPGFTNQRLQIITEHARNDHQLVPALESLLPKVDLLLALPDPFLYSRNSVKPLLITAYRFKRPVIAFSAALVKAGALAALYSTPAQIGRQTGATINARGTRLPAPTGPQEFSLSINSSVADAFGLNLPDETEVLQKLLSNESEP